MRKPNILAITTDQHAYHALSACGNAYVHTPNLDRLCQQGVRFEQAYCSDPVCAPSRTTWMTGRYSSETGVPFNGGNLHPDLPDLGTHLNRNGYCAVHSGKWHVEGRNVRESFQTLYFGKRDIPAGGAEIYDEATTHAAIDFLANYSGDEPFYLQVHYVNPHDICEYLHHHEYAQIPDLVALGELREEELPPLPANFHYDPSETVLQQVCRRIDGALIHDDIRRATARWTDRQWRIYLWHYYRFVEKVDREIGMLLDALEQTGRNDHTLVLFTSDHGESLASHQMFQKFTLYQESLRVPAIFACMGDGIAVRKGQADRQHLVSGADYMRTVCDYAGIEPPPGVHGRSLRPLVAGEDAAWREFVYAECNYYGRAIITSRYKYIMEYVPDETHPFEPPRAERNRIGLEQLFDLQEDPGETVNKVNRVECQAVLQQMRMRLLEQERKLAQRPIAHEQARQIIRSWSEKLTAFRRERLADEQKQGEDAAR